MEEAVLLFAIPVISSGKIDSRTSLSSFWSSIPIVKMCFLEAMFKRCNSQVGRVLVHGGD